MDNTLDMSCVMKVNRNCELCRQKVTEMMHSVNAVYSVDFVGADNSISLKARANPNLILAVIQRYGEHGKISNLRFDNEPVTSRPGGGYFTQSGYYLPSSYPPPHFAGNYACSMSKPPPRGINDQQHTAPPLYTLQPPPPRPLYSYSYIEPPFWTTSSSSGGGCCVIM